MVEGQGREKEESGFVAWFYVLVILLKHFLFVVFFFTVLYVCLFVLMYFVEQVGDFFLQNDKKKSITVQESLINQEVKEEFKEYIYDREPLISEALINSGMFPGSILSKQKNLEIQFLTYKDKPMAFVFVHYSFPYIYRNERQPNSNSNYKLPAIIDLTFLYIADEWYLLTKNGYVETRESIDGPAPYPPELHYYLKKILQPTREW